MDHARGLQSGAQYRYSFSLHKFVMQITIGCDPEHNQDQLQSTGPCREVKYCALDRMEIS
jgi:hypothetical protein